MRTRAVALVAPGQIALAHAEPIPIARAPEPPNVAPTLWEECVLCGSRERVRMGLYGPVGNVQYGMRCVDHDACMVRQARA